MGSQIWACNKEIVLTQWLSEDSGHSYGQGTVLI